MNGIFDPNIDEMREKYAFFTLNPSKKYTKIGEISIFLVKMQKNFSEPKNYVIKLIETTKSKTNIIKSFLEELIYFQNKNPDICCFHRIKTIYNEPNTSKFYIIQNELNKDSLRLKLGKIREIGFLSILREIIKFYYHLKDQNKLMKLILNPDLALKAFCIDNFFYTKKAKNKGIGQMRIKIDFLDFLDENEEVFKEHIETFHLKQFKHFLLNLMFCNKLEKSQDLNLESIRDEVITAEDQKRYGICTKNLMNKIIKEELSWNDYFNNPLFRSDLLMEKNLKCEKIWKIDKTLDRNFHFWDIDQNPDYKDHSEIRDEIDEPEFETTEKRKVMKKEILVENEDNENDMKKNSSFEVLDEKDSEEYVIMSSN